MAFISIGGFESSPVAEIAAEVKALLTEISKKRSEYIKEELDEAARLASDWQLSDAGMIVENHRAEPGFKDTIDSLLATISERLRYLGDESEAKNLVSSGKHEQARLKLERWLASPDAGIAQRARELYLKAAGEENPKMAFFLAGRYGLPNARLVNLDAFFIDKYEVTNAQYKNFLRDTERSAPLGWKGDSEPDLPVTGVSYYDAVAYAKSVGKRLLTQEEKARIFPWGNVFDRSKCNIGSQRAEPVGASSGDVSDCGAFDMAGNVCEWTETRVGTRRVVCGGSFADSGDKSARCDTSVSMSPSKRSTRMGFRCAKSAR